MKKFFTQTLPTVALAIALVGLFVLSLDDFVSASLAFVALPIIAAVLAAAFVGAKTNTLQKVGYLILLAEGAYGFSYLLELLNQKKPDVGAVIYAVGLLLMLVPPVFQFLTYCGFTRKIGNTTPNILATLTQYKEMEKEGIITAAEMESLKKDLFGKETNPQSASVKELKKWKDLLDQEVISAEEFAEIKKQMLLQGK